MVTVRGGTPGRRCLERQSLYGCVDQFFDQYSDEHLGNDQLSDVDWFSLTKVSSILENEKYT